MKPCKTDHAYRCKVCGLLMQELPAHYKLAQLTQANDRIGRTLGALVTRTEILMGANGIGDTLRDTIRDDLGALEIRVLLLEKETTRLAKGFEKFEAMKAPAELVPIDMPDTELVELEQTNAPAPAEVSRALANATGHPLPLDLQATMDKSETIGQQIVEAMRSGNPGANMDKPEPQGPPNELVNKNGQVKPKQTNADQIP